MTIQLELNKTYRTRDGNAEHKIDYISGDAARSNKYDRSWWADTGLRILNETRSDDLVEEVIAAANLSVDPIAPTLRIIMEWRSDGSTASFEYGDWTPLQLRVAGNTLFDVANIKQNS